MTAARDDLVDALWLGADPFGGFDPGGRAPDKQGWGSGHRYLAEAVRELRPTVIVEIGVWKGGSTLTIARALRAEQVDGAVIAVDTWLGSSEHWLSAERMSDLRLEEGRPTLQRTFMTNVLDEDLQGWIVPLPLDSVNASRVLARRGITADVIHIDAGHDLASVAQDLRLWWPRLRPGGLLIGDDYRHDGKWPGVRRAFDWFVARHGLTLEHERGKCRVRKGVPPLEGGAASSG